MPKKSFVKKKKYQAACKKKAKEGLINHASGDFRPPVGSNQMVLDYFAGQKAR